jgi:hypothetical protein
LTLPPGLAGEARERLLEVFAKIAAFAGRVEAACGDELACGPGCSGCCRGGLSLRAVEAAFLLEGARALASGDAATLRSCVGRGGQGGEGDACPLLHAGRCLAYEHRPAVCRTHGLPMLRPLSGPGEEAPLVHHCLRNFPGVDARSLPPSLLLDETRLSLLLDAVDALYGRESGWPGGRVPMDELLRAGLES